MSSKLFLTVTAAFYGMSAALFSLPVRAETTLKSAEIREVIRQVRLQPRNQGLRNASVRDKMLPEDALWTSKRSRAGLRFNDGSYARVGELALFRFTPGTRNFRLNNGTVLLLIKPGQGSTRIDTPNASAGVRGSALFVRYDEKTKTTLVGALTNNPAGPMEITAANGEKQALEAGQMAIVDQTGFIRRYRFDIPTFYETSDMVRGLDLPLKERISPDPAIAAVQRETADALRQQKPLDPIATIENPSNTKLSPSSTPLFNNGNLSTVANTNVPQIPGATVGKTPPSEPAQPTDKTPPTTPASPQPTQTPAQEAKPGSSASPPTLIQPNPGDPTPQPIVSPSPSPQPPVVNPSPQPPVVNPSPQPPVVNPSPNPVQTPPRQQLESTGGQAATKDPSAANPGAGGNANPGAGGGNANPGNANPGAGGNANPGNANPGAGGNAPNPVTPPSAPVTSPPNPQPVTSPPNPRQQLESTGGQAATKDPSAANPGAGGNAPNPVTPPSNPVTPPSNPVTPPSNPVTPPSTPVTSPPNPQPVTSPNLAPTQALPSQPVEAPSSQIPVVPIAVETLPAVKVNVDVNPPAPNLQPAQTNP
ncbi:MAG: FecR domain-containing protein [Myxacorys californica WJT36-NPBG1]|nr:FecR domain-containing protein [Myxacorys californica WJT36-NPBG1]